VTDGEFECVSPYMDQCAWSADDRFLAINCNRTGTWQPYLLEIETGKATQLFALTEGTYRNVAIDPVHGDAYVAGDGRVFAIDLKSLRARAAVDWSQRVREPSKGKAGADAVVLNRDGTLLVHGATTAGGRHALLLAPTDGSNRFQTILIPKPGMEAAHSLFCPGDDNIISFQALPDHQNDAGEPLERRVAQWRIHRATGAMKPLVLVPPGFRAIHSLWGRSGDRFYFHRKTVPAWVPTALCSVNREGEDLRVHYETNEHRLGHCSPSPDERWLATDSQDPWENILMLVSLERNEQHMLCWPNSSIKKPRPHKRAPHLPPHTDTDVHPNFSPSGRFIAFNSDASGRSHVYVVPVGDLVNGVGNGV
jgi:hypothetical protein